MSRVDQLSTIKKVLKVPEASVGAIIGKGGSNIKHLQQVPDIQEVSYNKTQKSLIIKGSKEAVDIVEAKVRKTMTLSLNNEGFIPLKGIFSLNVTSNGLFLAKLEESIEIIPAETSTLDKFLGKDYYVINETNYPHPVPPLSENSDFKCFIGNGENLIKDTFDELLSNNGIFHEKINSGAIPDVSLRIGKVFLSRIPYQLIYNDGVSLEAFISQGKIEDKDGIKTSFVGQSKEEKVQNSVDYLLMTDFIVTERERKQITLYMVE